MFDMVKWHKEWYLKNKKTHNEKGRIWRIKNKEKTKEYSKKHWLLNKEKIKARRKLQKDKWREYDTNYKRVRKQIDPLFKLKMNLRRRLGIFLNTKGFTKKNKFNDYIGCSPKELKQHIEKQFTNGMSWSNYGKWHIDHKIPLDCANTEDELYLLCHFSNLQPLWAIDNIKKSNKVE